MQGGSASAALQKRMARHTVPGGDGTGTGVTTTSDSNSFLSFEEEAFASDKLDVFATGEEGAAVSSSSSRTGTQAGGGGGGGGGDANALFAFEDPFGDTPASSSAASDRGSGPEASSSEQGRRKAKAFKGGRKHVASSWEKVPKPQRTIRGAQGRGDVAVPTAAEQAEEELISFADPQSKDLLLGPELMASGSPQYYSPPYSQGPVSPPYMYPPATMSAGWGSNMPGGSIHAGAGGIAGPGALMLGSAASPLAQTSPSGLAGHSHSQPGTKPETSASDLKSKLEGLYVGPRGSQGRSPSERWDPFDSIPNGPSGQEFGSDPFA